jgi:hypothetical protein
MYKKKPTKKCTNSNIDKLEIKFKNKNGRGGVVVVKIPQDSREMLSAI